MKIFDVTFFGIHIAPSYYGLMYALGFLIGYYILKKRKFLREEELDNLTMYIFFGVILGGRIGYILFYDLIFYISNPSQILAIWKGGMSFHGGVIGVITAMHFFSKKYKKNFFIISDYIVSVLPIGLGLGRIGNYLNKELLGKPYNGFLAVEKNGVYYFPSPLLEASLEGILLFIILNFLFTKRKNAGNIGGAFLFFYGIFRFLAEFERVPDMQIGYIHSIFTLGQILSVPMIILGLYFWLSFDKYPYAK